jgi:hypothetical protein
MIAREDFPNVMAPFARDDHRCWLHEQLTQMVERAKPTGCLQVLRHTR